LRRGPGTAVTRSTHVSTLGYCERSNSPLLGDVRVGVDRDVGGRVGVADEPLAAGGEMALEEAERRLPARHFGSSWSRCCSFASISAIRKRAVAIAGSRLVLLEDIHCSTRGRG
jgi:hypothetical protein